jgi:hypothetical protein
VSLVTKFASAVALKNLLQLQSTTALTLVLKTHHWLAVTDEIIRHGRCNVQELTLARYQSSSAKATEAVKAIASVIRLVPSLERLTFQMKQHFTDEAGVAWRWQRP